MSVRIPEPGIPGSLGMFVCLVLLTLCTVPLASCSALVAPSTPAAPTEPAAAPTTVPAPAPKSVKLSIESQPAGATAVVDGMLKGATPLQIEGLAPGAHEVELSMAGYEEYRTSLALTAEKPARLEVPLVAAPQPTSTAVPTPEPPKAIYPIAIMVENSWDARPQSGLAQADVLYEAPVEGGISRFMAVFINGVADNIGPVRSARDYFVYLAAEYNAAYVHIGSSPQGYAALNATELTDLDETYGDPGFWRIKGRYAPHNAYTNVDVIKAALDRTREVTPGGLAGFKFRKEENTPLEGKPAPEIYVKYPGGDRLKYVYSPEQQAYLRYMNGYAHEDADTGDQIAPHNLVVQIVDSWVIDSIGRLDMEQVGEGKAVFFRDGVATEGIWRKLSYGDVTHWFDADGNPVLMNPGKIFVQIIPPEADFEY